MKPIVTIVLALTAVNAWAGPIVQQSHRWTGRYAVAPEVYVGKTWPQTGSSSGEITGALPLFDETLGELKQVDFRARARPTFEYGLWVHVGIRDPRGNGTIHASADASYHFQLPNGVEHADSTSVSVSHEGVLSSSGGVRAADLVDVDLFDFFESTSFNQQEDLDRFLADVDRSPIEARFEYHIEATRESHEGDGQLVASLFPHWFGSMEVVYHYDLGVPRLVVDQWDLTELSGESITNGTWSIDDEIGPICTQQECLTYSISGIIESPELFVGNSLSTPMNVTGGTWEVTARNANNEIVLQRTGTVDAGIYDVPEPSSRFLLFMGFVLINRIRRLFYK